MSNKFDSLETDAAFRIMSLYPPENARAAVDRINLLQGENGLAIALTVADLDPQVSQVRRREGFDKDEFRLQLIGQLGLTAQASRSRASVLDGHSAAEFDLDA
jgi:hypothetical protein